MNVHLGQPPNLVAALTGLAVAFIFFTILAFIFRPRIAWPFAVLAVASVAAGIAVHRGT